ncbi:MAG TPA: putative zinc-binding metallopeptidase [Kofleriaceae bacterium]|nr:putative zinc-binding metallopeptidase [Kofleriaceae bacterium]
MARVRRELAAFGVATDLRFVWSGDGAGVVEDEPRVVHVHAAMVIADRAPDDVLRAADRTAALDMIAILRHEVGHALLFLDRREAAAAGFRELFGDITVRYSVGAAADEVERRLRRGALAKPRYRRVISLYAATHPHERFAEAVRLALATRGQPARVDRWVRGHGLDPVVGQQIRWAAGWLRRYKTV